MGFQKYKDIVSNSFVKLFSTFKKVEDKIPRFVYNRVTKLFVIIIIFIIFMIIVNYFIIENDGLNITNENSFTDSIYFTVTTVTSTGYGDILPNKKWSKMLVTLQQFFAFFLVISLMEVYQRKDITEINKTILDPNSKTAKYFNQTPRTKLGNPKWQAVKDITNRKSVMGNIMDTFNSNQVVPSN